MNNDMETEFIPGYGCYGWNDYPFTDRCPQCKQRGVHDKTCSKCGWIDPMIWELCPNCKVFIRHLPESSCQMCGYIPGYKKCHYCSSWTIKDGKCEDEKCYSNNLPIIGDFIIDDSSLEDSFVPLRTIIVYEVIGHETHAAWREYAEYKTPVYKFCSGRITDKPREEE